MGGELWGASWLHPYTQAAAMEAEWIASTAACVSAVGACRAADSWRVPPPPTCSRMSAATLPHRLATVRSGLVDSVR